MPLLRVFSQLRSNPRPIRNDEEAAIEPEGALHDLALGRLVLADRILLQSEVWNASRQLNARGGTDRAQRIMRNDLSVASFGQRRDLLAIRQPSRQAYVRSNVLHSAPR